MLWIHCAHEQGNKKPPAMLAVYPPSESGFQARLLSFSAVPPLYHSGLDGASVSSRAGQKAKRPFSRASSGALKGRKEEGTGKGSLILCARLCPLRAR